MRVCIICTHPQREAIERSLMEGGPVRHIGARFGVPYSSVQRHTVHIARNILALESKKAKSALDHGTWLVGKLRKICEGCEVAPRQFLAAADSLTRALAVYGKLTGEIKPPSVEIAVNTVVIQDPEQMLEPAIKFLEAKGYRVLPPGKEVAA
jgi:hypothetical protein